MGGEIALSNNYSKISKITGKRRKRYVNFPKDRSKHTCLIHVLGHLSYEFKILVDFGSKYSHISPTKVHRHDPQLEINVTDSKGIIILSIILWMISSCKKIIN